MSDHLSNAFQIFYQVKLISKMCGTGQLLDGGPRGADALSTAWIGHVGTCLLVRLSPFSFL